MSEPRFILSRSIVLSQFNKIKSTGASISYSAKTNYDVAKILEENTDCMFSMHEGEDINQISDKKRIRFFAQAWTKERIFELFNKGINKFVVDNENDLNILLDAAKEKTFEIELLLRMKLKEMTVFTGRYFVFGMPVRKINELIPVLRKNKLIKKLGIHFHRKTQNVSEWNYRQELEMSLPEEVLSSIDSLDIGGGLPAMYKNVSDKAVDIIFQRLKELCTWLREKNIEFVIEPGRFICAPAIELETEIVNIYDNNIILNCSIYSGAMDTIVIPIKLLVKNELLEGKSWVLKGISPCSMDIFRYEVKLKEPKIGDKITFLNAGGYNYCTDFCGFKKLKTIVIN